jgi:uncharacterized protein (TIGR02246 family)
LRYPEATGDAPFDARTSRDQSGVAASPHSSLYILVSAPARFDPMKTSFPFLIALLIPFIARAADTSDEAVITALEKDWLQAAVHKDEAKLRSLMAPDCWLIDSQGALATPDTAIAELQSGTYKVRAAHADDVQVRVMGDWAVVLGLESELSETNGHDSSGQFRFLDTWQKRAGRWRCVASAAIQIKEEK